MFFSLNIMSVKFYMFLILILIVILLFRGFLVRFRMDKMLFLLWKFFFPLMVNLMFYLFLIKLF